MDIMAILTATATITTAMIVLMETVVTRIVVIVIQGVDPVIGDEIKEQGDKL
jgi:hypothetical protein